MSTAEKRAVKVGKLVSTNHVDTVIRNYKKERWVQNSKRLGKEDSLSVWYSIEELEDYMEMVKKHGGDGIRFYFGAYAQDYQEEPIYAGRQTIVLVATKTKESGKGDVNKEIYIRTEKGDSILAYNAGRLCPPFCTPVGPGGSEEIGITIIDKGSEGLIIA